MIPRSSCHEASIDSTLRAVTMNRLMAWMPYAWYTGRLPAGLRARGRSPDDVRRELRRRQPLAEVER